MISAKQKRILAFPYSSYDALICDGAVRSGKTSLEMVAFVDWAMREFSGRRFGLCGKTVGSAIENIVAPYLACRYAQERYALCWRRSHKLLEVRRGRRANLFEVFGGRDEGSFALIQGRTLAGVLLDEVALMPQSFVNQALARCSVEGARFWFSCNPAGPGHWFKTGWIDQRRKRNALYLHFEMADNPALSPKTLARYQAMYSGVFYDRYVRGLWVAAEGLVYPGFDPARHVLQGPVSTEGDYYVSADYGIQNPNVFLLWRKEKGSGRWLCLREDYYSGREEGRQLTDAQLVDRLGAMLAGIRPRRVILDPSAASLRAELRRRGYHTQDADNAVLQGIQEVSGLLQSGGLAFLAGCKGTLREFGGYCWDRRAAEAGVDAPLKSGDHGMDAVRYLVRTLRLAGRAGRRPPAGPGWE